MNNKSKSRSKKILCARCNKSFKGQHGLSIHITKSHSSENKHGHEPGDEDSALYTQMPSTSNGQVNIVPNNCDPKYIRHTEILAIQNETSNASNTSVLQDLEMVSCSSQQHDDAKSTSDLFMTNQENAQNKSQCPHCGKFYVSMNIHISKAHPEEYRKNISSSYLSQSDPSSSNDNCTTRRKSSNTNKQMIIWEEKIKDIIVGTSHEDLDDIVCDVLKYFKDSIQQLPGPQHPAVKYFNLRRRMKLNSAHSFHNSTNSKQKSKRDRDKRREKYDYDLAQYNFTNQRRKVVRQIMNTGVQGPCPVPITTIEEYYKKFFDVESSLTSCDFPPDSARSAKEKQELSEFIHHDNYNEDLIEITEKETNQILLRMKIDTAPGPDGVTVRILRHLKAAKFIALLGTAMLKLKKIPEPFKKARTILLYKGGSPNDMKNWRPITIFSVVRRVIERVIETHLRTYVSFSCHQRGFVSLPGTHINTSLINGCLRTAKNEKRDLCVAFLDVSKAFDSISHDQIRQSMTNLNIPHNLKSFICELIADNKIQVEAFPNKTKLISVKRGVPQGSPLSPTLFNIVIDEILKELTDPEIAKLYGFSLCPELENLSSIAFADDIALMGKDETSILALINLAEQNLASIGLKINPSKSKLIFIKNGSLSSLKVTSISKSEFSSITDHEESIKYLGVNFNDEIVFDEKSVISNLTKNISNLCNSPLLKADQKLSIINEYIWPSLVYPLQCAPLTKIKSKFLNDVDKILRSSAKEIIGLPHDFL